MAVKSLKQKLGSFSRVFLDTAIIIYFFEENRKWMDLVLPIFQLAEEKKIKLASSNITALEVITGYKKQKREEYVEKFWEMLDDFGIDLLDFQRAHVEKAAQLRADFNLRTPDAIQLSLAINNKIPAFVTNDGKMKKIKELKIIYLGDFK